MVSSFSGSATLALNSMILYDMFNVWSVKLTEAVLHNYQNVCIDLEKYEQIKLNLLLILVDATFTLTELMEQLYSNVKDSFSARFASGLPLFYKRRTI